MNEEISEVRRGRPPKAEIPSVKKGKPTWKPANIDDVVGHQEGYRLRKLNKDPRNLAKKQKEGWEIISDVNGSQTKVEGGYGRIDDPKPLTTVREGYDYVYARMPEEMAQERDAYMNSQTQRKMQSLRKQTREELGKSGAPIHGSISMEQKGFRTVIKE